MAKILIADDEADIRDRTVADLEKALGSQALRELGIDPNNIFEFGRDASALMMETIARRSR